MASLTPSDVQAENDGTVVKTEKQLKKEAKKQDKLEKFKKKQEAKASGQVSIDYLFSRQQIFELVSGSLCG